MKIIKEGKPNPPPQTEIFYSECDACGCGFEFEWEETHELIVAGDYVRCPNCGNCIKFPNRPLPIRIEQRYSKSMQMAVEEINLLRTNFEIQNDIERLKTKLKDQLK